MENYYRVLELIEENKDNMPQGHYIEIMEKFKKSKDEFDKQEERTQKLLKDAEIAIFKKEKDLQFEKEKMKKMDKDKRIKILKTQIQTLKNKCDAYHIGLHEFFEDIDTENIESIHLSEFDKCPFTGRALYEFTIQKRNDGLEGSMECNQTNNYVRCYCCNVKVWENNRNEHWSFRDDEMEKELQFKQSRIYCKNCLI